ncbi:hypothetical protein O988_05024 [Pseudogymnoascus sp. VKM F-3808]|nr:hypothetical protein O988_05024 [Pseudogymnoascus sp. VKM F-3808]
MSSPRPVPAGSPSHINPLTQLPPEILNVIIDQVPNSTIKNLRLTCRFYLETVPLRLNRVFISANPCNVEVFTAIANHEVFRTRITEIIWDDALLHGRFVPRDDDYGSDDDCYDLDEGDDDAFDKNGIDWRGKVPGWFRAACRDNVNFIKRGSPDDVDRPSLVARVKEAYEQMAMEASWAHYQELVQQQQNVLDSMAHIIALEKHIGSFPALRRITITPAAHGWIYNPLYETPMIRAFPYGFNHIIPRSWPLSENITPECDEWEEEGTDWQGFRTVTRVLTEGRDFGRVVDLRIDVHELETGLNSRVFEKENRTLSDFEAVLVRPDFEHLQLDLMVDPHYRQADVFRSGLLKRALARASCGQGLKSLSLRTNIDMYMTIDECDWYVPLTTIFTPASYSRLQHFGLARFYVEQDDLLALLACMPKTLRSVELSMLEFMDEKDSYRTLLWGIRDMLGWKERDPRPILVISTELSNPNPGRALWLEHELYSFLYEDGDNPFGNNPATRGPSAIRFGFGWEKDCFDPDHKRPHVDNYDLADLGYIKGSRPRPGARPTQDLRGPGKSYFTDARYLM